MERIILEPETEKNFKLKHDFIKENAPNEVKVINKAQNLKNLGFLCLFIAIYYVVLLIKYVFYKLNNPKFFKILKYIIRDIILLLFLLSIFLIMNYYEVIFSPEMKAKINLDMVGISLAYFCLLWLLLGFYYIFISNVFTNNWTQMETMQDPQDTEKQE